MAEAGAPQGVMLCERPGPTQLDRAPGLTPFFPSSGTSNLEPLGLCPTYKALPTGKVPPPSVNLKHKKELKELEAQNRALAAEREVSLMEAEARSAAFATFNSVLRSKILAGEDVTFWKPVEHAETIKATLANPRQPTLRPDVHVVAHDSNVDSFVDELCAEASDVLAATQAEEAAVRQAAADAEARRQADKAAAAAEAAAAREVLAAKVAARGSKSGTGPAGATSGDGRAPAAGEGEGSAGAEHGAASPAPAPEASTSGRMGSAKPGRKGGKDASKPAWALTAEEAEEKAAQEEELLLSFADQLDFDGFVGQLDDVSLQDTWKALQEAETAKDDASWRKSIVRAINNAALRNVVAAKAAREDDDNVSVAGMSEGGASTLSRAAERARERMSAIASQAGEKGNWDASTKADESDVGRMERTNRIREAADVLREAPELRSIHSPASVLALLKRTEAAVGASS